MPSTPGVQVASARRSSNSTSCSSPWRAWDSKWGTRNRFSITKRRCYHPAVMRDPIAREFLLAFWKIHILHHATDRRGVYGQWMLEELHQHGYRLSPGTLYPILARMAERG